MFKTALLLCLFLIQAQQTAPPTLSLSTPVIKKIMPEPPLVPGQKLWVTGTDFCFVRMGIPLILPETKNPSWGCRAKIDDELVPTILGAFTSSDDGNSFLHFVLPDEIGNGLHKIVVERFEYGQQVAARGIDFYTQRALADGRDAVCRGNQLGDARFEQPNLFDEQFHRAADELGKKG